MIQHFFESEGLRLSVYEWKGDSPPILLIHATGFHARCWDQVTRYLKNKHVFAIDMMGHGMSEKPVPPLDWAMYTQNLIDFFKNFDLKGVIGVGHSFGGYALVSSAAQVDRFAGLLLIDPVIYPPGLVRFDPVPIGDFPIARRKNNFSSPEEMFEQLKKKGDFPLWDPAVLKDYCTYGLIPKNGGYQLACPPLVEAATYLGKRDDALIYEQIKTIDIPVWIIRARDRKPEESQLSFGASPTNPELVKYFKRGKDIYLPHMSHFIPMQDPKLTANYIEDFIRFVVRFPHET